MKHEANTAISLQDAIRYARSGDTIELTTSQNVLLRQTLVVAKNLSIINTASGPGYIAVDPSGQSSNFPLFQINNGATLNITGFNIVPSNITTNSTNSNGSAFDVENGTLNLTQCTIYKDSTSSVGGAVAINGGAIYVNVGSTCNMVNSTIFQTSATTSGGAIYNNGTLNIQASTINSCSSQTSGGGIYNSGNMSIANTILAGNIANGTYGDYYQSSSGNVLLNDNGFNVIGKSSTPLTNITDWLSSTGGVGDLFYQVGSPLSNTGLLNISSTLGLNGGDLLTLPIVNNSLSNDNSIAVSIPQTVYSTVDDPSSQALGFFGNALGVNSINTLAAVGAPGSGSNPEFPDGIVYIYNGTNGNWAPGESHELNNGSSDDEFGYSVAVDGNNVLVGAPGFSPNTYISSGGAFIYTNNSSTPQELNNNPNSNLSMGTSVGISGNNLVVGGPGSASNSVSGRVDFYTYNGNSWAFVNSVTNSDSASLFGTSIAIDGDIAVIGAPGYNNHSGEVYIYNYNISQSQWILAGTIYSPTGAPLSFGESVAISGDGNGGYNIIVGAPNYYSTVKSYHHSKKRFKILVVVMDGTGGSAYIYNTNGSSIPSNPVVSLQSPNPQIYDSFGYSVAISGNTALVGVPFLSDPSSTAVGSVYMFNSNSGTWNTSGKLISSPNSANRDAYGNAVTLNNSSMIVGAFNRTVDGNLSAGEVYISNLGNVYYNGEPDIDERGDNRANSSSVMRTIGAYDVNGTAN